MRIDDLVGLAKERVSAAGVALGLRWEAQLDESHSGRARLTVTELREDGTERQVLVHQVPFVGVPKAMIEELLAHFLGEAATKRKAAGR
jgi:hypothetical protein